MNEVQKHNSFHNKQARREISVILMKNKAWKFNSDIEIS